jgi:hypothetical protein
MTPLVESIDTDAKTDSQEPVPLKSLHDRQHLVLESA